MAQWSNDNIEYYFNLAIEQYSDINIVFLLDQCPYSRLTALCVGIKNGHFIVRVALDQIDLHPLVWGSEANCYFQVRDAQMVVCHFVTKLVRIYNAPPHAMFLVFPLPAALDHNQRRFGRRVTLYDDEEAELRVWHCYPSGGDDEELPVLRWEDLARHQCELDDLSANGMRLRINEKNPYYGKLHVNDRLLLRGNFGSSKKPARLYAMAQLVRKTPLPDSEDDMAIGCQFISWRKTDDAKTWFRADQREGIAAIAQWISRNFRNLN